MKINQLYECVNTMVEKKNGVRESFIFYSLTLFLFFFFKNKENNKENNEEEEGEENKIEGMENYFFKFYSLKKIKDKPDVRE